MSDLDKNKNGNVSTLTAQMLMNQAFSIIMLELPANGGNKSLKKCKPRLKNKTEATLIIGTLAFGYVDIYRAKIAYENRMSRGFDITLKVRADEVTTIDFTILDKIVKTWED